ncbi:MAG: tetratricopeptide repeat protein [Deltaproteobacteria bacterium]|nr:tetratricopeptide repeat protein [Deltaproteobacteria bacterium]
MKKDQFAWHGYLLLIIFFIASCGGAQLRKEQADAIRRLGEAYINDDNYTRALKELLKAEKLYPDDHFLHNDLGIVYKEKGRLDLAIRHFKKALKLKPGYAPARNNLGAAYFDKKDCDAAIACFEKVSNNLLYATPHYPLYNLGKAYYHKQEYLLSEKFYLAALEMKPYFAVALEGLGQTYLAMGKIAEAVAALEGAVKAAPEFAKAYLNLGKAYQLSHRYKKARDAYNKVISLEPKASLAVKAEKEIKKLRKY